jgi:Tfp pilus assembly PilM family ATPase
MNVTTLNITANSLKAAALSGAGLKRQEAPLPPGAVKNGLVLQPETMGRDIRSLFSAARITANNVICTINGLPFTYRILTIPGMRKEAFHEAVLRTAKDEMSISPDEMYLTWQAYPAANGEYQVLVAGITRRPVDSLIKALGVAGIRPWRLDLPHLALARLCPHKDAVIVDFEKDCSNIVMIVDGVPRGLHMVPALASGAGLQDQVGQVTDKLAKMIEFYNSNHPAKPIMEPVKILVTGELLEEEKTFEFIKPQIDCVIEPLASANNALAGKSIRQIAVNAGMLAACRENGKDILCHYLDMGDIVKDHRPKTNLPGLLKKVAVPFAVVGGITILTFAYLSLGNAQADVKKLQADYARAGSELVQKQALSAQAQQQQARIDDIASRVAEIKSGRQVIFSSREYNGDISAIIAAMPKDVTFNSLNVDPVEITLEGTALMAAPVIMFADNLEKSGAFSQAIITWIDKPRTVGDSKQLYFKMVIART